MSATLLASDKTTRWSTAVNFCNLVPSDTVNGNTFSNEGANYPSWIVLSNLSAQPGSPDAVVTIKPGNKVDIDLTVSDRVFTIPAGQWIVAGPFDKAIFNQSDGTVQFTTSEVIAVSAVTLNQ